MIGGQQRSTRATAGGCARVCLSGDNHRAGHHVHWPEK